MVTLQILLNHIEGGIVSIDLFPGAHESNAFDKGVPVELVNTAANHANIIVEREMTMCGLGKHVNNLLNKAPKSVIVTSMLNQLPHPTMLSAYLVSNNCALLGAAFYDKVFHNPNISFVGHVLQHGLNPDKQDGIGGVLGASSCYFEKITGKTVDVPHPAVHYYCETLGISDDIQAEQYLHDNNHCHLEKPHSRTAIFLSNKGIKGGSCGVDNDYRVVEAQAKLYVLLDAEVRNEDAITIAEKNDKEAKRLRKIIIVLAER